MARRFSFRQWRFVLVALAVAAAALLYERWPGEAAVAPLPAASYRAVDGDSLRNSSGDIRLLGIDAVELRQTCRNASGGVWNCGREAHQRLRTLVSRGVDCRPEGRDRYGRTLARCYDGERDIGETMVREGLAVDFMGGGYAAAERDARAARRGIWAGEFDRPQEHRRHQPPRAAR